MNRALKIHRVFALFGGAFLGMFPVFAYLRGAFAFETAVLIQLALLVMAAFSIHAEVRVDA